MFGSACTTSPTGLCDPSGLAFDPTGNLWISDTNNNRVVEYLSSNLITGYGAANVLGQPDLFSNTCAYSPTTPTGLCDPTGLTFDPTGNLWISDSSNNRVLEYLSSNLITGDGAANVLGQPDMFSSACTTTPTGLCNPFGITFDPSGNLWISDSSNNRVLEYLTSNLITGYGAANVLGQPDLVSSVCTTSPTGLCGGEGITFITFDPTGNLWVADLGNNRVLEYLSSNLITGDGAANVLGQPNFISRTCTTTPTGFCDPEGLAFDPSGNLWISDAGNNRVLEYLNPPLSVSCSPTSFTTSESTTCTATLSESGTDGESIFFSSSDSSTGTFTPASCALSSESCSVAYSDTATGTPTITATYLGDLTYSESSANTMLTITAATSSGGLHITNSGGGGVGGSGATTSTIAPTSTATSTAITTTVATTTIFVIFNSSYNITPNSNTIINVPDSGTTIVLESVSSSGSVSVIITNVTGSTTTSPQSYKLLEALNISTMPPLNITITVTMKYNCSLPSNSIAPYELTGTGTWNPINPFTINSTACTVTFAIPADPIVGIFQYQQIAATSTVPTITTSLATSITTTVPASAASSKSSSTLTWVAIIAIAIVVLVIIYLFIFRRKKRL